MKGAMHAPTRFLSGIDYWPVLEIEIAWVEAIGENERFSFVLEKVRRGENPSALIPVTTWCLICIAPRIPRPVEDGNSMALFAYGNPDCN